MQLIYFQTSVRKPAGTAIRSKRYAAQMGFPALGFDRSALHRNCVSKLIRRRNLISGRDHRPLSIAFTGYHQCPGHAGHLVCERYSRNLGIAEDGQDFFDFVSGRREPSEGSRCTL